MQFSIKMMTPFFVKSDPFNFGIIVIYYTLLFPHILPCLINHRGASDGLPAGLCPVGQAAVAPKAVCPIAGVVGTRAAEHCGERGRKSAAVSSKAARLTSHGGYIFKGSVFLKTFVSNCGKIHVTYNLPWSPLLRVRCSSLTDVHSVAQLASRVSHLGDSPLHTHGTSPHSRPQPLAATIPLLVSMTSDHSKYLI